MIAERLKPSYIARARARRCRLYLFQQLTINISLVSVPQNANANSKVIRYRTVNFPLARKSAASENFIINSRGQEITPFSGVAQEPLLHPLLNSSARPCVRTGRT